MDANPFRFLSVYCLLVGFPPRCTISGGPKTTLKQIYFVFAEIMSYSLICKTYGRTVFYKNTMDNWFVNFNPLCYLAQKVFRMLLLRTFSERLIKLEESVRPLAEDTKFAAIWRRNYKNAKICAVLWAINNIMWPLISVTPVFLGLVKEAYPFNSSYLFIDDFFFLRYVYAFIDLVGLVYVQMRTSALDLLCLTLIAYQTTEMELLLDNMRNILARPGLSNSAVRHWVQQHQQALRHTRMLKEFVEPLLSINYIYGLVSLVGAVFYVIMSKELDWILGILVMMNSVSMFILMGWMCAQIDRLNTHQEMIAKEFDIGRICRLPWMKYFCLNITVICYKPINIQACKCFNFNSKKFSELGEGTISLFAAMLNIRKKIN